MSMATTRYGQASTWDEPAHGVESTPSHEPAQGMPPEKLCSQAQRELAASGIDHAEHEALALLAAAAHSEIAEIRRWVLLGAFPSTLSTDAIGRIRHEFQQMVTRRRSHEPLQYIVGTVGFRYLELAVGPGVFIPRPETETVTQGAIDWLERQKIQAPTVVDLCAGSGAIGLSIATEVPHSEVTGVEISNGAFAWLSKNRAAVAMKNPRMHYRAIHADAFAPTTLEALAGTVDCVISNPPYVPQSEPPSQPEVAHDPRLALYGGSADGMVIPKKVIAVAARLLRPGGYLVIEHAVSQASLMREAFGAAGFKNVIVENDLTGRPRFSVGVYKGS